MTLNNVSINAKGVVAIAIAAVMAGLIMWMVSKPTHQVGQTKAVVLIEPM